MINKTIFDTRYKMLIEAIKQLRQERGITQRELAKQLNKTHCYVGRIETCERRMDILDLINILRALNLSDSEILKFIKKTTL